VAGPRLFPYVEFYLHHFVLLVGGCFAYLYASRTDLLDWSLWLPAFVAIVWLVVGSPLLAKIVGHDLFHAYRAAFVRSRGLQLAARGAVSILVLVGIVMFQELVSRFKYVETVKSLTIEKGSESLPYPTPKQLADAYNRYPHRKEVLFILNRMARLLAFDDQTANFNRFTEAFLAGVDVERIVGRYSDSREWQQYEGSVDPVLVIARLHVETTQPESGRERALALIKQHRGEDPHGAFYRLLYEHDHVSTCDPPDAKARAALLAMREEVGRTLASLHEYPADDSRTAIKLATTHAFQELMDHYVQLHMETVDPASKASVAETVKAVPQLYSRILTVRQNVASATDVPWLETAGKFSLYHYFKHAVGRPTAISECVRKMMGRTPGLTDAMDKTVVGAEAFKEFRDLAAWDRGTPQSAAFAGTGMHKKLVEWLKTGW
jgi:hypothetical protein